MQLCKLGEFGLIERFRKLIKTDASVVKGSGDDCAVLRFDRKHYQLFTCDMIVEGVDFNKKEDPYLVGRKALAISISDISACAGIPRHAVVSVGLPRITSVSYADKLFKGMLDLAKKFKVNIVGGDMSTADKVVIDVSMLGLVEKNKLLLRSGAKKGDLIFVTGGLGGSISGKHLTFIPRFKEAQFLVQNFKLNSMIDVSDGLAQDLGHIVQESGLGAVIYEELIPQEKDSRGLDDALYSGEDFELLFTLSRSEAKKILRRKISGLRMIGEMVGKEAGITLIDKWSRVKRIKPRGFRHF